MADRQNYRIQRNSTTVDRTENSEYFGEQKEVDQVDVISKHEGRREFTGRLGLAVLACILGSSFQVGYNTGAINAPEQVIKGFYNTSYYSHYNKEMTSTTQTILWSATVSIFCIGGMIGGISAGYWANRYGRKGALLRNNLILVIAVGIQLCSKYVNSYWPLIVGRFIVGIGCGINTGLVPMYLSEISPLSLRGLCGTLNQLAITFGVLISEITSLKSVFGTAELWPFIFGFSLIPVVFQLLVLPLCPESPQYLLIEQHKEEEAEQALIWLRRTHDVSDELEEMITERENQKHIKKFSMGDLWRSHELRRPLIISIVMQLSQQWSGINAVINYSTSIFTDAGLSESGAQYATLATGAVNVLMTCVAALLMDRLGRRTLHLAGLGGLFITSYILTVGLIFQSQVPWFSYVCVIAVIGYIIAFATGPGAIPWFIVAELFAQGPRSAAVSVSVLVNWTANFTVGLGYPFLELGIKAYSFIPFVIMLAFFWLFTLFKVPETKGRTIEQITASFRTNPGGYQPIPNGDKEISS